MTRKKVKLAYIANDSARKATFKKRKKGLVKKVSELTTLCDVEACAIIYSPYQAVPEVYPSPLGAQRVLGRFRKMPEMDQSKKMVNQEGFLRQRISKASDQLKKLRKDNRKKDVSRLMFSTLTSPAASRSLNTLSLPDLNDLTSLLDRTLAEVTSRLSTITATGPPDEEEDGKPAAALALPPPPPPPPCPKKLPGPQDQDKKPQWFMELMMNHNEDQVVNHFEGHATPSASTSAAAPSTTNLWGHFRVFP